MRRESSDSRFAERIVHGVAEDGGREEIMLWIERRPGGIWAVGRAIDPERRPARTPRRDDYVFEGYDIDDALEVANDVLSDELAVSMEEGVNENVEPFAKDELLRPLERWFFGHRPR